MSKITRLTFAYIFGWELALIGATPNHPQNPPKPFSIQYHKLPPSNPPQTPIISYVQSKSNGIMLSSIGPIIREIADKTGTRWGRDPKFWDNEQLIGVYLPAKFQPYPVSSFQMATTWRWKNVNFQQFLEWKVCRLECFCKLIYIRFIVYSILHHLNLVYLLG